METLLQARTAEIILSVRWRRMAKIEGIRVEEKEAGVEVARGSAVVAIRGLRVEAEEVTVKWLSEDKDTLLVHGRDVNLFRQVRGQPYETKDLAMLTMANDQVSFFR